MIWNRPYLLSPSLENKCSGKGTYALLVGEKRVCFALPSGSAQRSPTEHRICSPVLLLLMWQFQVFIKNIWNHWGYSVRILKHRHQSFYIQTRADSYNFAFCEYFLFPLRTYSKTLFIIDNRLEQQFYEINCISLLPVSSIYSPSTRGPEFFNWSFLVRSCHVCS